jgi:hypothetical protein
MKFVLKGPFNENLYSLMRKIGYHFQKEDKEKKEFIFTRPPKGYPRFHIYLKIEGEESKLSSSPFADARENENLIFNLHLDQKRPIYKGAPAHAGEYDSEVVEKEAERIKQQIIQINEDLKK